MNAVLWLATIHTEFAGKQTVCLSVRPPVCPSVCKGDLDKDLTDQYIYAKTIKLFALDFYVWKLTRAASSSTITRQKHSCIRLADLRTGKPRLLAISLAAVFIIMSSSSGSMVRNCLDRFSLTGVHGKSKRPSLREVGLPSVSLPSRSNVAKRVGDSGRVVIRARPRAASKSDRSANKLSRLNS